MNSVVIYTDGACDPNPGVGGWAAIIIDPETKKRMEISGGEPESTNNRMEMTAAIEALSTLAARSHVDLHVDSEYVMKAFTQSWLTNWKKRGWKTADKKPVKNQDLWEKLDVLVASHDVKWNWIRGHADDVLNNRCDELAVQARLKIAAGLRR